MADTTYYELLEVEPDATQAQIKTAFRQQALRNHPDQGGNAALFRMIEEAYETLVSPSRRSDYDARLRSSSFAGAGSAGNPNYEETRPTGQWDASNFGSQAWANDYGPYDATGTWDAYDGSRFSDREPPPEAPPQFTAENTPGRKVGGYSLSRIVIWSCVGVLVLSVLAGVTVIPGLSMAAVLQFGFVAVLMWLFGSFFLRVGGWALGIIGFIQGFLMEAPAPVVSTYLIGGFLCWLAGQWLFTFRRGIWRSTVARVVLGNLPAPMRPDRRWQRDMEAW